MKKMITALSVAALAGAFMFASTGVSEAAKKKAEAKMCYEFWVPVCGKKGKKSMTYANQCKAMAAGAKVTAQGECSKK